MNLRLLHRRLAVAMGLTGLLAFAGGAGFEWFSALLATVALVVAFFWHPDAELSARMERLWLPLATLLVIRALYVVFIDGDIVIPVVDLLLLLLAAESLRSLDAPNDLRLYALSFALILASTAYRPGILFLIAFVSYVILATVALMVGHLRRQSERHQVREVPLGRGLVTTTGGLSLVILVVALGVFLTFPRVSQGWAGRGDVPAASIAGFSDQVSIGEHGSTILGNPQIVLRVEFPDSVPGNVGGLHWRGRSYDRFDGIRWTRSNSLPPSSAPTSWYRDEWPGEIVRQRIFGSALDTRVLFALHPALEIDSNNGIQPLFDNAGDFLYWGRGAPAYTAYSRADRPAPDDLRAAARGYYPSDHFLQLPRRLDPRIAELADSITRGLDNRYDQAMAVQRYLQSFTYTRQLPATARETTLQHFLFERQAGHCEYFSTAMVVMLRTLGIQARNVNGFLGGQWNEFGSYLVVTQNEAHSWVEVWFPGYGWVTFDPTPAGSGTGEVSSAWFWPGRILFDGIQHRWNKWVLDYSVDDQVGIFAGLLGERTMEDITSTQGPVEESSGPGPLTALAILLFLAVAVYWARGLGGPSHEPWTRMYLQLREAAGRAGLGVSPGVTPLALVERIRAGGGGRDGDGGRNGGGRRGASAGGPVTSAAGSASRAPSARTLQDRSG
ncbi:MAG: transglutaminaseTgpA domain-containing protein, partial [Longimicrobiales bacterium]|nr:transglutaminaseTgpA domain-containing protein [Longimicrobiales bacterium]